MALKKFNLKEYWNDDRKIKGTVFPYLVMSITVKEIVKNQRNAGSIWSRKYF